MKTEPNEAIYPLEDYYNVPTQGLTKRELFAAMAMQGLITGVRASGDGLNIKELIQSSIMITDEFIKELNKQDNENQKP